MPNLVFFPVASLLGTSLLSANLIQTSSLLLRPFSRSKFRATNRWCYDTWGKLCVEVMEKGLGIEFIETGDPLPEKENAIVIANHQKDPDVIIFLPTAARCGRLGDLKWFAKEVIKYVPGAGWGLLFLDSVFLKRDWSADAKKIQETFAKLQQKDVPFWLVSFPEGTRITPAKLKRSQDFAEKNGLPVLKNVLLPRTRGFVASVQALRERAGAVYDVTVGYSGGIPTLQDFLGGKVRQVHLHFRRFPIQELPTDQKALERWILDRFVEKDALMEKFHQTGKFA